MGKSNRFDYTNRSNSGPKLGHIIGSALQKEADKAQKDAARHLQKARKQSADSTSTSSDALTSTHIIDLKAPGKALEDAGVCALLDGLEMALRSSTHHVALILVELDLSGNCITTSSLARLAPVLELACHDLRTLNLAGNKIKVENAQEAAEWDTFLQSFTGCSKLRTLDFSDNSELGHRALEIMARVYATEPQTSKAPITCESSRSTATSDDDESDDDYPIVRVTDTDPLDVERDKSLDGASQRHHLCGLRSIPYVALRNVGLDDAGAMWLSYVLQDHWNPDQLNPASDATLAECFTKSSPLVVKGQGIDWSENKALGKEGIQLLEKTEILRRQTLLEDDITFNTSDNGVLATSNAKEKKKVVDDRQLKLPQDQRRASVKSIRTSDSGEHDMHELESARKKIKRAIIARDGASSVELWQSALNLCQTSRLLLYLAPPARQLYTGPTAFMRSDAVLSPASTSRCSDDGNVSGGPQSLSVESVPSFTTSSLDHARSSSYVSKLARLPRTNGSVGRKAPSGINKRKDAFGDGNGLQSVNDKLNRLQIRDEDPLRFVRYQEKRITESAGEGRCFRDIDVPCHLPSDVVERIANLLTANCGVSIMHPSQRQAAIGWGQRRDTLTLEREWLRKDESAQVLMLLDSIKCLAYRQ